MHFAQVVGQAPAKEGLTRMIRQDHLPHALLLLGAEGTGGLPMALALAQYLFCTDKRDQDSCGQCADCRKVARLEHADLHLSFPSISPKPGTKALSRHFIQEFREFVAQTPYASTYDWLQFINAENKQGNITAEECREIIDILNLKSYEGGRKVLIMWRPEYLGKEGNMLLKLIEEPPAGTVLIFVAENTEDILPTILSRTQTVRLRPIPAGDIAGALTDRSLADPRKAAQVAHMSHGSFAEALRLVQHTGNDLFPVVRQWFNGIFLNKGLEMARFVEEQSKLGREQQKNFLQYVIGLLEQSIRVRYRPEVAETLPPEEGDFIRRLAGGRLSLEAIGAMVKHIADTSYFIERNANAKAQLHALSIRLSYVVQGAVLPEI